MKRWAWNLFCAASLMVFAISVSLFVLSWFAVGEIGGSAKELLDPGMNPPWYGHFEYFATCSQGEILFARMRIDSSAGG